MSGAVTWEPKHGPWLDEVLVSGGTEAAVMARAEQVAGAARATAPVDTGRLRASFKTTSRIEGDRVIGYAYTDDEIAPYVEFGDTPSRGFFRRAAGA